MLTLARFLYSKFSDQVALRGEQTDFAPGSMNLMPLGLRAYRPFRNLLESGAGSRLLYQIKDGYGGLDDAVNPDTGIAQQASGSLFSTIADILVYVGHGQVSIEGEDIPGAIATSLLQILLKWNGSYTDPGSSNFIVGLTEPSAPEVGILNTTIGGTPTTRGTYSFREARLRGATGGKSRASGVSKILNLNGQAAYVVAALSATGQTIHPFFVTTYGLGGIGLHFRIPKANPFTGTEYTADDIERTVQISMTNGSPNISATTAIFTAADVGKRFKIPTGANWTVPMPTTVLSVAENGMSLVLSNPVTTAIATNPRPAVLISYINNIDRAVILNWQESDLAADAAEINWIYDFPPPSASHAFQLDTRIAVLTHADSASESSSTNTGTALVFSLANQLESFDLRFPLYLPGGFVDVLGRGIDSYVFIGCRNGIYAIQYLNSDTIPATLSVLLANEGIKTPQNWAISKRWIYLCTGDGKLTRTGEGGAEDSLFYEDIRRSITHWTQENTVITNDAEAGGVTISHLGEIYYFDEQTSRWSTPLYLRDHSGGNVISGIGARSEMILTIETGDGTMIDPFVRNAYKFDRGTPSFVVGTSASVATADDASMIVQMIKARLEAGQTDKTAYIALHRNNLKTYLTDAEMTAGSNLLSSEEAEFSGEYLGSHVLVKKAGTGGAWLKARIKEIVSPTEIRLGTFTEDLSDSADLNAVTTVEDTYCLIAHHIFPLKVNRKGTVQVQSPEMFFNNCHSVAASILIETDTNRAQPLEVEILGTVSEERWNYGAGSWGAEV